MAIIPSGILSHPKGKIGEVVGATWKGIKYIRSYVIPSNPNTTAQIVVRTKFATIVKMAKALLGGVLQPYWDPFLKSNSGWAEFIGRAMKDMTVIGDFNLVKIAEGSLENTPILTAVYAGTDVTITWDESVLSNGALTDGAIAFVYDAFNGVGFVNGSATRDDETVNVTVGSGRASTYLHAYLFFAQPDTDPDRVSTSDDG